MEGIKSEPAAAEDELSEEEKDAIQSALNTWIEKRGFSNQDISLAKRLFPELFKAETGFTPREWRLKMYGS